MQIRVLTPFILLFFILTLAAEENLLTKWRVPHSSVPGKHLLPEWRFSDWGPRPPKGGKSPRKAELTAVDGKVQVTLENPAVNRSVNMIFRQLSLDTKEKKLCRLKVRLVNNAEKKALVRFRLHSSGVRNASASVYAAVGKNPEEKELTLLIPEKSKSLQIIIKLLGGGKVTFSDLTLTLSAPPQVPSELKISPESILLPERTPVEFSVKLPPNYTYAQGDLLKLTLPWGVRLVNFSPAAKLCHVDVRVKSATVSTFELSPQLQQTKKIHFLLASDLKSSAPPLAGSAVLEQKNRFRTSVASFQLKTVKDLPALPPRHYRIALQQSVQVPFREVFQDAENGLLRSGANILLSPRILVAEKQLKVAKISRQVFLPIQAVKAENHCYYSMLRTESFWERHYIPSLRRHILRFGCRRPEAIICDNYLGQRRAIHCLCSLCRMEFGEFAPKLPKKDVMNLSTGIMEQRMSRELRAFRNARLNALWAGAKLHLPVDSRHFQRAPRLVPLYTLHEILHKKPVVKTHEAVIDFGAGAINPESSRYTPEVDFAVSEHILKTARMKFPKRTVFTAKFTPQFPAKLSEQELQFAILNYFLSGFNGIWIVLPQDSGYEYRRAVAQSALILREHERFLLKGALSQHPWKLRTAQKKLPLPPVPGPAEYPLDLPSSADSVKLLVFRSGAETLLLAGNFTSTPLNCTLINPETPLKWQGNINGIPRTGLELKKQGIPLTLAPHKWAFIHLKGI